MINQPFTPQTATVNLTVGTASSSVAMPANSAGAETLRIVNSGTNTVFIEIGNGPSAPTATATTSIAMLPNSVETFGMPRPTFVAAIAGATGNTLYITVGMGA